MTHTRHRIRIAACVAAAGVVLSACGDSPPATGAQSQLNATATVVPAAPPPGDPTGTPASPTETPTPQDTPTPTAPSRGGTPTAPAGCADVTAEAHYCLTLADGQPALLGLDSGRLCDLNADPAPFHTLEASSIAWLDGALHTCADENRLYRVDLDGGGWSDLALECSAVTAYRGGLLVASRHGGLIWYASVADAAAGRASDTYDAGMFVSRIAVQGDLLYGAWHSTGAIEVYDLAAREKRPPIVLEEYDDWIHGLAITADGHLVISGPDWGRQLVLFDAASGLQLRRLVPEALAVHGLACVTTAAATPVPPTRDPSATPTATPSPCADAGCPTPTRSPVPCEQLPTPPALGRIADFPPSLPVPSCHGGGTSSNFVRDDPPDAGAELHVVAVYEGVGDSAFLNHRRGRVRVTVGPRPRPVVLALSAYEPVQWEVTVAPGARLERVILSGYHDQRILGLPDGVAVQSIVPGCGYAYGWEVEHNSGGGDHRILLDSLRAASGLTETSFQGCYRGESFPVPHWLDYPPSVPPTPLAGDETVPRAAVDFPGCEAITAESAYCLTVRGGQLALVGIDSGSSCALAGAPLPRAYEVSSLGWRGEIAYACGRTSGLMRIHLPSGAVELAQVPCEAVTDFADGLLVLSSQRAWTPYPLNAFADYGDVLAGQPSRRYQLGGDFTRMTADGDRLYAAWHAGNALVVADLGSGAALQPLPLEDFDSWVDGLALVGDALLLASWPSESLIAFDATSGARRPAPAIAGQFGGLACASRAPEGAAAAAADGDPSPP